MRNPKFSSLLKRMEEIHDKKNSDYANDLDPYSNFNFAAQFADVDVFKVYLTLIGVKAARLIELLDKNKEPKNESVNDTLLDFATYATIMASHLIKDEESNLKFHHCSWCGVSLKGKVSCATGGHSFSCEDCFRVITS